MAGVTVWRPFRFALFAVAVLSVAALSFWAGRTVTDPPDLQQPESSSVSYTARSGELSRSIPFSVEAEWVPVSSLRSAAGGVVTRLPLDAEVSEGDPIISIDERPVIAVASPVPFFREMSVGSTGRDVLALEEFLVRAGLLAGDADQRFDAATGDAVATWQSNLELEATGLVERGDVSALPGPGPFPVRAIVDLGVPVDAGDVVAEVLESTPRVSVTVAIDELESIPPAAEVVVQRAGDELWTGRLGASTRTNDGLAVIMIEPIGSPICDAPCDVVPIAGAARLSAQIVIQRPVVGVVVPTAAIRHDPGGAASVRTPTGEVTVSVVTSVDGLAIVDGIPAGTEVVLPEEPVD
jgi:peptidoglycan hydrolase-like protein with peptidoglycan-binding domain